MKKIILLIFLISLISLVLYASNNRVPMEDVKEISYRNARSLWGNVYPAEPIPYYSINEEVIAYCFNYSIDKVFPDTQTLIDECESKAGALNKESRWGADEYGHIIMSNSYDRVVTLRYIKSLSDEFAYGAKIKKLAIDYLRTSAITLEKIYYITPMLKYYKYTGNNDEVYVRIFPPMQSLSSLEFHKEIVENYDIDKIIPKGSRSSWDTYLSGTPLQHGTKSEIFIPDQAECVPFLDWSYGCSPTAGAMLLDYWDNNSFYSTDEYSNLTKYHFQRWDPQQDGGEWDYNVSTSQYWCCIHMETDSLTGNTNVSNIGPGLINAANSVECGSYDFAQTTTLYSTGSDPTKWNEQIDEIDNGRPWHCGVPNHSMTAIGYEIAAGDSFMIVHNTWNPPNDWWNYAYTNRITETIPGGHYGTAGRIEKPNGDPRYSDYVIPPSQGEDLYAGDVYEITWDYESYAGSYAKLHYNITGGRGNWNSITTYTQNDGVYDWLIPDGLTSSEGRIKIEIYDTSDNLIAADGSWGNFIFHTGGSIEILSNDSTATTSTNPDYYLYDHTDSSWCAIGVRSNTSGENWNMTLYSNDTFTSEAVTSDTYYPVDFVVIDGNHTPNGYRGIKAGRTSGTHTSSVEFEGGNDILIPGNTYTMTWPAGDVVEMWDVHLTPGYYMFELIVTSGSTDLDIALFGSSDTTYYGNRSEYLARSINYGGGTSESFTYTAVAEDEFGFCVWANNTHPSSFEISIKQSGVWLGTVDNYWSNSNNWSCNIIPDASMDVTIPSGTPYTCWVSASDQECNNITIESDATLKITDKDLNVHGSMIVYGELIMESSSADLYISNDAEWKTGSSASINGSSVEIWVTGNWIFESGANVQLNNGYVAFQGVGISEIISHEENCYFNHLRSQKSGSGSVEISNVSTEDLYINENIFNYAGSIIKFLSPHSVVIGGYFNNYGGHFEGQNGTLIFNGTTSTVPLKPNTGDYLHNLTINTGSQSLSLDAIYSDTLRINGSFVLESGYFNPGSFTLELGGDWTNNAGINHFFESSSNVIFNGSGNQYINSNETFYNIEVDCGGALTLQNAEHTVNCNTYDWTSGGIDIIAGTFTALDLTDDGIFGTYKVHLEGTINLHQNTEQGVNLNGSLTISGGTLNVYGGSATSYWPWSHDASLIMNDGVLDFHDNGIRIYNSPTHDLSTDISGGIIRTPFGFSCERSDFNPTGGVVELYGSTNVIISMIDGSNFYDLQINKVVAKDTTTKDSKVTIVHVNSDTDILGNLIISEGTFNLNNHTVEVTDSVNIYGSLQMTSSGDTLSAANINWLNGSSANVTDGEILFTLQWLFDSGTSAQLGTGNIARVIGPNFWTTWIKCNEPNASFGNLLIDRETGDGGYTYLAASSDTIKIAGDMIVFADNEFRTYNMNLLVEGSLDIQETGLMSLESLGTLVNYSDFILNGNLFVSGGQVVTNGDFELAATGEISIDGGEFMCDAPYSKDKNPANLYGTMILNDGLFEISNNSIIIDSSFVDSINGGIIRTGGSFIASYVNTFEPTGGIVEMSSLITGSSIQCSNGNYFYTLKINGLESVLLDDDVTIHEDFEIISGVLTTNMNDMYIGGNWTNNVGDSGFLEGNSTVTFNGGDDADITTDEIFYNLVIDKTSTDWWAFEVMDSLHLKILNNLIINDGTLEMNTGSYLEIGNDLNIASVAGLNAYGDTGLTISIEGNWIDDNTLSDEWKGFYPGTSIVTFQGAAEQILTTDCNEERFYDLIIDKSNNSFKPDDNIYVLGNLSILNGAWQDNIAGLNHNLFGDVYVGALGDWIGSGSTVTFKGTVDQTFEFLAISYLTNIVVDKTDLQKKETVSFGEELPEYIKEENTKGQTLTLHSDLLTQTGGTILIEEGTLYLNGHEAGNYGDIVINNGGIIHVDNGASLKAGDGYELIVNSGGILKAYGLEGDEAKITRFSVDDYYDFTVEAGGIISAEYANFEYMTAQGVHIKDGALIDSSHSFNHCTFSNGIAGGTLLTINNNQSVTIDSVFFPANTWSGSYNVTKTVNQGNVTFVDAGGAYSGSSYENDIYDLIDWSGYGADLTITDVVWSNMSPYICDTIDVSVTVKNIGVAASDGCVIDLYYDLSSPPVPYQTGDQFTGIPTIIEGDSIIVMFTQIFSDSVDTWNSYIQIDTDQEVAESDENNNIWGPDIITWQALPAIDDVIISYNTGTANIELDWSYPVGTDSFCVYRDTDPYFVPSLGNKISTTTTTHYSEPASGDKYFYKVTAVKSCANGTVVIKNQNLRRINIRNDMNH